MTTFFQMAQAINEDDLQDIKRWVRSRAGVHYTPQSAMLLNPVPHSPQFHPPRLPPFAVNDNSPLVAKLG